MSKSRKAKDSRNMNRFIPKRGQKFKVMVLRPTFKRFIFISEGEVTHNKLKAHRPGDKKATFQFDLHQYRFKACE